MTETKSYIHPTAQISDQAQLGDNCVIWQNCIVSAKASLGSNVKLGHNVYIEENVHIGSTVTIKDNVCLYDGLIVSDDVFIGPGAIFTNVLEPRSFISGKDKFLKTEIKSGVTIGAGAVILCGITINTYAFVGAGAIVTRDVPAHALITGNPAKQTGWVSRNGKKLDENLICPESGEKYKESSKGLVLIED